MIRRNAVVNNSAIDMPPRHFRRPPSPGGGGGADAHTAAGTGVPGHSWRRPPGWASTRAAVTFAVFVLVCCLVLHQPTSVDGHPRRGRERRFDAMESRVLPSLNALGSEEVDPDVSRGLAILRRIAIGLMNLKNRQAQLAADEQQRTTGELEGLPDSPIDAGKPSKRTCLFNGGMSHSCDYKDVVGAVKEASYWNSDMSPGRKKRGAAADPVNEGEHEQDPRRGSSTPTVDDDDEDGLRTRDVSDDDDDEDGGYELRGGSSSDPANARYPARGKSRGSSRSAPVGTADSAGHGVLASSDAEVSSKVRRGSGGVRGVKQPGSGNKQYSSSSGIQKVAKKDDAKQKKFIAVRSSDNRQK